MSTLPSNASQASYIRYQMAYELAQLCPPALGREVVLTGSVSRGLSDEYSDIEQVFYVDAVSPVAEREQWLQEVGATEVVFDAEPIEDGSIWATFLFRDVWVEAGWQSIDAHERNLQTALSGNVTDHWLLMLAELTVYAIPLRSVGLLSKWQQELSQYPDNLQQRLIANATELWMFPNIVGTRWALVQRG